MGAEYAIGADVAEGLATGDYSVAEVVNTATMETVARWRGKCDPDRFGEILAALEGNPDAETASSRSERDEVPHKTLPVEPSGKVEEPEDLQMWLFST